MPSRRDQIAMTDAERRDYLRKQQRLILVSNGVDGYPHPMPMNFVYDDQDRFVMTTFRKSQKVRNFERDPKAALLVESGVAYSELRSVLAYAEAEIVDDHALVLATVAELGRKESMFYGAPPPEMTEQVAASLTKRVVLRFSPKDYISWDHSKLGGVY